MYTFCYSHILLLPCPLWLSCSHSEQVGGPVKWKISIQGSIKYQLSLLLILLLFTTGTPCLRLSETGLLNRRPRKPSVSPSRLAGRASLGANLWSIWCVYLWSALCIMGLPLALTVIAVGMHSNHYVLSHGLVRGKFSNCSHSLNINLQHKTSKLSEGNQCSFIRLTPLHSFFFIFRFLPIHFSFAPISYSFFFFPQIFHSLMRSVLVFFFLMFHLHPSFSSFFPSRSFHRLVWGFFFQNAPIQSIFNIKPPHFLKTSQKYSANFQLFSPASSFIFHPSVLHLLPLIHF